jgi:hypothetical protein
MPSKIFKVTVVQHWLYDSWIDSKQKLYDEVAPGARFVKARRVMPGAPGTKEMKKISTNSFELIPVAVTGVRELHPDAGPAT